MAEPSSNKKQVALFITCLSDQFYPRVGIAVTKILEHFGCSVHFPQDQTCCGQPFYNNGFSPDARELAKRHIEIFEPYPYVVSPSGSCAAMVRDHYPELFANDPAWEAGAKRVCDKTYEFVEFLDKVLNADLSTISLPKEQTITYHYTCHLRGLKISDTAPRLLTQIGNVKYAPLDKIDQCCGFGGTFAVKYPHISGAIVDDKTNCIAKTEAQTLISNDAGCSMNISGMCHRKGMTTQVKHIAELIAEALNLDIDRW
jgi:L-lactate dehydrogenase complex protein LldE